MINNKYYEIPGNELVSKRIDVPILPNHNAKLPKLHFSNELKNKMYYTNEGFEK